MEHNHTQFAALTAPARPSATVTQLRCREMMRLDYEPVEHIFASKGEHEAEEMVCRVLEDIAYKLDALQCAKAAHSFDGIMKPARRIVTVGAQIGLTDVIEAAAHVTRCAEQGDGVALSATVARLERAFDVAVTQIWRYREGH